MIKPCRFDRFDRSGRPPLAIDSLMNLRLEPLESSTVMDAPRTLITARNQYVKSRHAFSATYC
jgi:hypothetical protein